MFIGINAHSALGALEAADALGRHGCTAVVSQNVSKRVRRELREGNPMLIGGVDYCPDTYGEYALDMALNILTGQLVPPAAYTEHLLVNADNVDLIYPNDQAELRADNNSAQHQPHQSSVLQLKLPPNKELLAAIQSKG